MANQSQRTTRPYDRAQRESLARLCTVQVQIKAGYALLKKACGRVFQTDTDVEKMKMSGSGRRGDGDKFQKRITGVEYALL